MLIDLNFSSNNKLIIVWLMVTMISIGSLFTVGCATKNDIDQYSNLSAKQIYDKGKDNIIKDQFQDAILDFEALESNYPYGKYTASAKLSLMYAYYRKENFLQVKAAAEHFIKIYPDYKDIDYVYYMHALASYNQYYSLMYKLFNLDRSKRDIRYAIESFDMLKDLIEKVPHSKYCLAARKLMIHLRDQIANHELHIANYYLVKGAYLAAINRSADIIGEFTEATVVKRSLEIMAKSYKHLNMPDLERQAMELIEINFKHPKDVLLNKHS